MNLTNTLAAQFKKFIGYKKNVLEVGCGTGQLSIYFSLGTNNEVVGLDPTIESLKLAKNFKNVQILWASVREPYNYLQAKKLGCHIITIPPAVIDKIEKFGKSFNQLTIETVKAFLVDSKKSNFKI